MAAHQAYPGSPAAGAQILNTNSFSILTGQSSFPGQIPADPNKYVVKNDHGQMLLTAINTNAGAPMSGLSIRDLSNIELLRLSYGPQTQVAVLSGPNGAQLGSIMISAKPIKEHKKDKIKEAKKQVLLESTGGLSYTMTGKTKHGGSNIEMKIKSSHHSSSAGVGLFHGDKKHKDKDKKHKDKKSQIGEVSGNLFTGFHVKLSSGSHMSPQDRINVIGLVIGYMELERQHHGHGGPSVPAHGQAQIHNPYQSPIPGNYVSPPVPGAAAFYPHQQVQQPFSAPHPGAGPYYPGAQVANPQYPGGQPGHVVSPGQMGFSPAAPGVPGFISPNNNAQYQPHHH